LVARWRQRALQMVEHARTIRRRDGAFDLVYRVVTGDVIRSKWPELFAFYQDEHTVEWIRQVTGDDAVCNSERILSAVNLNIMDSEQAVYRWHFDAVAYTVLIYLTDTKPEGGGALEMIPRCRPYEVPDLAAAQAVQLFPGAGTIVLMDGTRCYHRVSPMKRPTLRLSIPLVYPNTAAGSCPAGLDSYLYDQAV
jgi:2OG-Fe(II) oxygenase superfamily